MRRHLRNTRRGWMIFNEADKGGAAGGDAANPDPANPAPGEKKEEEATAPAAEAPATPATTTTAAAKPSVFSRAAAMLKDKSELLSQITERDGIIAARDAVITNLQSEIGNLKSQNTELLAGKAQIEAALATAEKKSTTASAAAVDIVASLGFPENKLPAASTSDDNSDAALYDRFQAAGPEESTVLMSDPKTAARIKAESARRIKQKSTA